MMKTPAPPSPRSVRWPWVCLVAALAWSAVVRVPLVLNAEAHLDSDLAVDGLTLVEALAGHWRWHFPGTPHLGTAPLLFCWAQARIWGANPWTLVSGGTVAFAVGILATFVLALRLEGPRAGAWSLLPLACSSTGAIWLSGRITGGHILMMGWIAGTFALLLAWLQRAGTVRLLSLGLVCGLGLASDRLFAFTLAGVLLAVAWSWWRGGVSGSAARAVILFVPAFLVGYAPYWLGRWSDPYDAYAEQFEPVTRRKLIDAHARLLVRDCLPRLLAGHRLGDFRPEPQPGALQGTPVRLRTRPVDGFDVAAAVVPTALFLAAIVALGAGVGSGADPARAGVRIGLLAALLATLAGFVVNRHIYDSDNYRYLVGLLVPWSLGFGRMMDRLCGVRRGWVAAAGLGLAFATLMTSDTARWYRRFGWLDDRGMPHRQAVRDPALDWLKAHPEVWWVAGDYWDVYRIAFLMGGVIDGYPFPPYPDRFPDDAPVAPGRSRHGAMVVLARDQSPLGAVYRARMVQRGAALLFKAPGLAIYEALFSK